MPKVHAIQCSFAGGEIDAQLEGCLDIAAYSNSVKTQENAFCLPQGGSKRRGGWHYIDDTKYHDKRSQVIPFIFSSDLAYGIETGDQYFRFYKDGYQIKFSVGPELILNGTFDSDLAYWTDVDTDTGTSEWVDDIDLCAGGTPTADSIYGGGFEAAKAVDDDVITCWASGQGGFPHWLQYQLAAAKTVIKYSITGHATPWLSPKDFKLQGSNDEVAWETLDTQTGLTWAPYEKKIFQVQNSTEYEFYRIYVTATGGSYVQISELELINTLGRALELDGGAGGVGAREQAIAVRPGKNYTLLFDVYSTVVDLRIGTTSGGVEIIDDEEKAVGSHVVTFTTAADTIYLQFRKTADEAAQVDNVSLKEGTELITNPTFNTDITGWTDLSFNTGSIAHGAGVLELMGGSNGIGWAEESVTTVVGQEYCVSIGEVIDYPIQIRIGTASGGEQILEDTAISIGEEKKIIFTATTTTTYIGLGNPADNTAKAENVFCRSWEAYEITSPYLEDDLPYLRCCQYADSLYLVHPDYPPQLLICVDDIEWTLEEIEFIDGPYFDEDDEITITPSATTGEVTLTASAPLFVPEHVGALWRLKHGAAWGYCVITAFTDSTHVTAEVKVDFGAATASDAQREGMWSDYRGYPATVSFYGDRVVFGGSLHKPQSICGSKVGIYEDMTPGTDDNNAYIHTLTSKQTNQIFWIQPTKNLLIGTMGDEFKVSGGADNPITPSNVDSESLSNKGSADIDSIRIDNSVLFVQKSKRRIRELAYNWEEDSFSAQNISILAEGLSEGGILELAYQQEPHSIVWAIRNDGLLLGLTFEKLQKVIGWHHHPTDGEVESITVIPNATERRDDLLAVIKRTVEGETRRYVERLNPNINTDCALTGSFDDPVSSVSGLDHLIGKTVDIVGDGAVYPGKVVDADGEVELEGMEASEVEVGLHYESDLLTLRPEVPISGTSQGIPKHWARVWVRLYESQGCTVGGQQIQFRKSTDLTGTAVPPFTGDVSISKLGWDADARINIKQTLPLPMHVICLFGVLELGD